MKKYFLFLITVAIICSIAPSIFMFDAISKDGLGEIANNTIFKLVEKVKNIAKIENNANPQKDMVKSIDSKNDIVNNVPEKIKLLLTNENKVVEIDFNDYIKGVLLGEMPVDYEVEALKAQALVARTYTLYKLENAKGVHENADMCDDINCCQCYKTKEYAFASWDDDTENEKWKKIDEAVDTTKNQSIIYSGESIAAFFHANSGGKTEDVRFVWGGEDIPYLKSVNGYEIDYCPEEKVFSKSEFENLIKKHYEDYKFDDEIKIISKTESGRVSKIKFGDNEMNATTVRNLLGLKSTKFDFEISEDSIKFVTKGYGHGVGMSQVGANQMAKERKNI